MTRLKTTLALIMLAATIARIIPLALAPATPTAVRTPC